MILVRDFESKVDREQEKRFLETENISLFIVGEERLERIDSWSWPAIKKIVQNKQEFSNIKSSFVKWNKSIDFIIDNMNTHVEELKIKPKQDLIIAIEERNIFECRKIIESFSICKAN